MESSNSEHSSQKIPSSTNLSNNSDLLPKVIRTSGSISSASSALPNSRRTSGISKLSSGVSPRPSLGPKSSLTVPGADNDIMPGEVPNLHVRRCSARLLSVNVREALKQLRQKEHKARVTAVVQRNADFYRRQRCCEGITLITLLLVFSAFSLYVLFAYGFYIGKREPFLLIQKSYPNKLWRNEGESVELYCQADTYWEWCRWVHYDRYCDFEWVGGTEKDGVEETSCDFEKGKATLIGDYNQFQCGLRIQNLQKRDRGLWICEVEKYYAGFSRRYGELQTATFTVVVSFSGSNQTTVIPQPTSQISTEMPSETPFQEEVNDTIIDSSPETIDKEEYNRQFFLLKVFILGGIGLVIGSLAVMFSSYFMYLWKSWDANKRPGNDPLLQTIQVSQESSPVHIRISANGSMDEEQYAEVVGGAEFFDYDGSDLANSLLESRRKSVSFAVCTPVKEEKGPDGESKLSFDITVRSVTINPDGVSRSSRGSIVSRSGSSGNDGENPEVIKVTVSPTPMSSKDPLSTSPSSSAMTRDEMLSRTIPRRLSLAPEDALFYSRRSPPVGRRSSWRRSSSSTAASRLRRQSLRAERSRRETQIW